MEGYRGYIQSPFFTRLELRRYLSCQRNERRGRGRKGKERGSVGGGTWHGEWGGKSSENKKMDEADVLKRARMRKKWGDKEDGGNREFEEVEESRGMQEVEEQLEEKVMEKMNFSFHLPKWGCAFRCPSKRQLHRICEPRMLPKLRAPPWPSPHCPNKCERYASAMCCGRWVRTNDGRNQDLWYWPRTSELLV